MSEEEFSKKKAWQRPENWVSWAGLGGLGFIGFLLLDKILPILNRVLENGLYAIGLGLSLATITWIFINKDFHKLAAFAYKSLMRKLTSTFIELDPIGILKTYIEKLKRNLNEIQQARAALKGQARKLEEKIRDTTKRYEHSMNMAAQAKAKGGSNMQREFVLQARKGARLEKSNLTYVGLLNKTKAHLAVMEKIQEAATFMVADIEDTVEEETQKREMIRESHKAMKAAKRILAENEQREMYDMAMEHITADYFSKLGEIEQFMEDTQQFVNTMDLENGVFEAEALEKLNEWEKRSMNLLEGGTGKTKFRVSPADIDHEQEEIEEQSFAELFKKI